MKTLITSILTFMCCVGMGQTGDKYIDSVMRNAPQLPNWALPVRNDYSYNFIDSVYPKRDTIEILALVTDTTHEYTEPYFVDSATMISDSANILWFSKGKQIYPIDLGRKTKMPTYSTIIYQISQPFEYYKYLDNNMLPLKKSIIIWQVKYLK